MSHCYANDKKDHVSALIEITNYKWNKKEDKADYIDGLVQERCNCFHNRLIGSVLL